MLIRVRYCDGRQNMVQPDQLCAMIRQKHIQQFKRFYGWADISCVPVREKLLKRSMYKGPERRKTSLKK